MEKGALVDCKDENDVCTVCGPETVWQSVFMLAILKHAATLNERMCIYRYRHYVLSTSFVIVENSATLCCQSWSWQCRGESGEEESTSRMQRWKGGMYYACPRSVQKPFCVFYCLFFCQLKRSRYSIHVLQTEKGRDLQLTGQTSFALHVLNIQEVGNVPLIEQVCKTSFCSSYYLPFPYY